MSSNEKLFGEKIELNPNILRKFSIGSNFRRKKKLKSQQKKVYSIKSRKKKYYKYFRGSHLTFNVNDKNRIEFEQANVPSINDNKCAKRLSSTVQQH